ncbi:MAG: hypothetical protein JWN86_2923 [Planctomycetota bacterium]|nr:hypothetical protein [Planctomycetota bacterium]
MELDRFRLLASASPGRRVSEANEIARLERTLLKMLDEDGIPRRLAVGAWWQLLSELAKVVLPRSESWSESIKQRLRGLLIGTMRFSRPDGSAVFEARQIPKDRATLVRAWATFLDEPGVLTVAGWWFGRRRTESPTPPPLPTSGHESHPLAMLRPDWRADGDFLAVDHRTAGAGSFLELQTSGETLLGRSWLAGLSPAGVGRGAGWSTGMYADRAEWSFRVGDARVVRTAVLLRGRKLALLADEWIGAAGGNISGRFSVADGVEVAPVTDSRALSLKINRASARAFPLALPALPYATDRGSLVYQDGELVLTQKVDSRRVWAPLLLSWDKLRNRRPARWRRLTVSEKSKNCPSDIAFAARVGWGHGDGLVVYRSLARPALRTFLGHQTSAKFLIGLFNDKGDVVPLLKVDG